MIADTVEAPLRRRRRLWVFRGGVLGSWILLAAYAIFLSRIDEWLGAPWASPLLWAVALALATREGLLNRWQQATSRNRTVLSAGLIAVIVSQVLNFGKLIGTVANRMRRVDRFALPDSDASFIIACLAVAVIVVVSETSGIHDPEEVWPRLSIVGVRVAFATPLVIYFVANPWAPMTRPLGALLVSIATSVGLGSAAIFHGHTAWGWTSILYGLFAVTGTYILLAAFYVIVSFV